jgi:hypothetical protein
MATYTFDEQSARRIGNAVLRVERLAGISPTSGKVSRKRGRDFDWLLVQMQGTMHHDKTTGTKVRRVLNCDDDGKPVVSDKDDNDFEIRAGLWYGLWMKKDLVWIQRMGKYWQPVNHGRQYIEGTLSAQLAANGTATITIDGQQLTVKEGGFASATIPTGRKVGCQLAATSSGTDPSYEWRAIIARC